MNTDLYRDRLTAEKSRIEEDLAAIAVRNPHNTNDWEGKPDDTGMQADPEDQAELLETYAENVAVTHELEVRLAEIEKALMRIENGTYGVCEVGGEQIEEERLQANPAAATCITHR